MNYWINSHWPSLLRDKPTPSSPDPSYQYRVYLPDGREAAGEDLAAGDYIFIYETKTGRTRADGEKYSRGKQGIIALVRAQGSISEEGSDPEEYADGTSIDWKWQANTKTLEKRKFCPRVDMCRALKYKPTWTLYGFGDLHSGLKRITEEQYHSILSKFR